MRKKYQKAEKWRLLNAGRYSSEHGNDYGVFEVLCKGVALRVMVSAGSDEVHWEHVSVSTQTRCPTWRHRRRNRCMPRLPAWRRSAWTSGDRGVACSAVPLGY